MKTLADFSGCHYHSHHPFTLRATPATNGHWTSNKFTILVGQELTCTGSHWSQSGLEIGERTEEKWDMSSVNTSSSSVKKIISKSLEWVA